MPAHDPIAADCRRAGYIFLLLVLLGIFSACTEPDIPAVVDPGQLIADCQVLLKDKPAGDVDPAQWPASIKRLSPNSVTINGGAVYIRTFAAAGVGARGYCIARTKPEASRTYIFSTTPYEGVYRFDFTP